MKIDLSNLICCKKCGCIFDYTINAKIEKETDFAESDIYIKQCPCCKKEVTVFE